LVGLDASRLGYGPVVGSCECGSVTSGCIQVGEIHETLSDCQLLKTTCSDEVSLSFSTVLVIVLASSVGHSVGMLRSISKSE
jgi:hypothetical protein